MREMIVGDLIEAIQMVEDIDELKVDFDFDLGILEFGAVSNQNLQDESFLKNLLSDLSDRELLDCRDYVMFHFQDNS